MRPNRKIRIGIAIIAVALLLWGIGSLLGRLLSGSTPPENNIALVPDNTVVEPVSASASGRIVRLRDDANVRDAVKTIPARTILTPDMLEFRDPKGGNVDLFVTDIENGAVGYITNRELNFGQDLRKADLVGHISEVGIAGALLPGRRAMIVPLPGKNTLHDLVRIGDRVDVLASFDNQEARTVVQDVRVLAVDVFGKDYPSVKVAMRGDYKAAPRNVGVANPPSPSGGAPAGGNPDAAPGGPNATPTPTPTPGAPAARPDPALTLEVTPEQATAISLTQSSGQNLDFLIRSSSEPRPAPDAAGGAGGAGTTTVQVASITRARLAPYATRNKQAAPAAATGGARTTSNRAPAPRPVRENFNTLPMPQPAPPISVPPLPIDSGRVTAPRPETYEIPVYADGKMVRMDTVRKPQD
jgi:Flp pilus assembly protein CpaB